MKKIAARKKKYFVSLENVCTFALLFRNGKAENRE